MKKTLVLAVATTLGFGSVAAAADTHHSKRQHKQQVASQPKERLGTLSCEVAGGIGLLIGSSERGIASSSSEPGRSNVTTSRSESSASMSG